MAAGGGGSVGGTGGTVSNQLVQGTISKITDIFNETISDYVHVSSNQANTSVDVTYRPSRVYFPGQAIRVSVRAYKVKSGTSVVEPSSILKTEWIYVPPAPPLVTAVPIDIVDNSAFVRLSWFYSDSKATTDGIDTITFRWATGDPNRLETSASTASISRENGLLEKSMIVEMPIGQVVYVQAQASSSTGNSAFGAPIAFAIGKNPVAPTTWSSTNTVIVGEKVILFWTHNPTDASEQTQVRLLVTSDKETILDTTFKTPKDDEGYIQSSYILDTSEYPNLTEGAQLNWSVWTWGVDLTKPSPQSEVRKINVYARPEANAYLSFPGDNDESTLTSFPLVVGARPTPFTQKPIGYFVSVIALDSYEDVDVTGNIIKIAEGQELFSRDIDIDLAYEEERQNLLMALSAGDINLSDGQSYQVGVTVSMDSGLSATEYMEFSVSWDESTFSPNANVYFDENNLTASVYPYVEARRYEDDPKYISLHYDEATNTYIEGDYIEDGEELLGAEVDDAITNNGNPVYFYELPDKVTQETILLCFKDDIKDPDMRIPYSVYTDDQNGSTTYLRGNEITKYYENFEPIPDAFTYPENLQVYKVVYDEVDSYKGIYYTVDYGELYYPEDVLLNVFRIQYDGSMIAIATDIENTEHAMVVDPHPALDFARYRISAQSKETGAVAFIDMYEPTLSENDKLSYCVIQWDETWQDYSVQPADEVEVDEEDFDEDQYSGSTLKLPWNIDLTDNYDVDVAMVDYIGRKSPVTYYGTKVGLTTNLSTDVDKMDTQTLYAIRRLASYRGDVYVREPSGNGYWASIKVNYTRSHNTLIMPVSIDITRVEGGI